MVEFSRLPVELGHVTVSPVALAALGMPAIRELLRDHAAGKRGDLTPGLVGENALAIATREGVVQSIYRLPNHIVLVMTEIELEQTSLLLAEEI